MRSWTFSFGLALNHLLSSQLLLDPLKTFPVRSRSNLLTYLHLSPPRRLPKRENRLEVSFVSVLPSLTADAILRTLDTDGFLSFPPPASDPTQKHAPIPILRPGQQSTLPKKPIKRPKPPAPPDFHSDPRLQLNVPCESTASLSWKSSNLDSYFERFCGTNSAKYLAARLCRRILELDSGVV